MRKSVMGARLVLPLAMLTILLLALAYWWLDNLPHEIFGTIFVGLLGWHIWVNRIWFLNLFRGRYDSRRMVILALHLALIANMAVLVVTSVIISKAVFAPLPLPDSIYLRDIHWFAAYWVMVFVGIHLGLNWVRVSNLMKSGFGIRDSGTSRLWIGRALALAIAAFGWWSFAVLDVWSKLTFTYSLDFWDFTSSVAPFFAHWLGVIALPAVLTHMTMAWWRAQRI